MLDRFRERMGAPAAIMGSATAATALADKIPWLPQGPGMLVLGAMFSLVLFFVKRDYGRINGELERHAQELIALAAAGAARATELEKRVLQVQADLLLAIADCVKVKEAGNSATRIYDRINRETMRITIMEAKLGMHDSVRLSDPEEDLDKTPPLGVRTR
jgi:hypothetical protein